MTRRRGRHESPRVTVPVPDTLPPWNCPAPDHRRKSGRWQLVVAIVVVAVLAVVVAFVPRMVPVPSRGPCLSYPGPAAPFYSLGGTPGRDRTWSCYP